MHAFYQGRLAKAFLAEEAPGFETLNRRRSYSKLDEDDTLDQRIYNVTHLEDLIPREIPRKGRVSTRAPDSPIGQKDGRPSLAYSGPYLILNASVNLSGSKNPRCRDKKALNFVFTPKYCGYTPEPEPSARHNEKANSLFETAYRRTAQFGCSDDPGIRLAFAMATSGSALGPNMGRYTTARRRVINTVLNLRLGWWISNPRHGKAWFHSMPKPRLFLLIAEFFGVDDSGSFINLSDGGHFENLGIYELVRRQCKLIVVSDASQDGSNTCSAVGMAVERCRTDLGYEIELDLTRFMHQSKTEDLDAAYSVGCVKYAPNDIGEIVYFKAARVQGLPPDLASYAARHPSFPHQSTANQWFSESRFESYRKLGFHIVSDFLKDKDRNTTLIKIVSAARVRNPACV
jgi:hypothetical protein